MDTHPAGLRGPTAGRGLIQKRGMIALRDPLETLFFLILVTELLLSTAAA